MNTTYVKMERVSLVNEIMHMCLVMPKDLAWKRTNAMVRGIKKYL